MTQSHRSPLIFVSYAHDDIERVRPLVEQFKKRRWHVWWDRDTRIGDEWREVIVDRLQHARCVVVVWTRKSVKSQWVCEEAEEATSRGALVPVRLDKVRPPMGFRTYQYADLASWSGGPSGELKRLLRSLSGLLSNGVDVPYQSTNQLEWARNRVDYGANAAQEFLQRVRAQSAMFKANPAAAAALAAAFRAVSRTYDAVLGAVDRFLQPLAEGKSITAARYRSLCSGNLKESVEAKRGHCTELAEKYIAEGGLKDSLPGDVPDEVVRELDALYNRMSYADMNLFDEMASIGDALANESAVLLNLVVGKQEAAARRRLKEADKLLQELVRRLNDEKAELNKLAGVLGIKLKGR